MNETSGKLKLNYFLRNKHPELSELIDHLESTKSLSFSISNAYFEYFSLKNAIFCPFFDGESFSENFCLVIRAVNVQDLYVNWH